MRVRFPPPAPMSAEVRFRAPHFFFKNSHAAIVLLDGAWLLTKLLKGLWQISTLRGRPKKA